MRIRVAVPVRTGSHARLLCPVALTFRPRAPARKRKAQDRAMHRAELAVEGPAVVRQVVAAADVAHARGNLGVAAGGQIGEQVVLDLEAKVAADEVKRLAALDVGGAGQLSQIPL